MAMFAQGSSSQNSTLRTPRDKNRHGISLRLLKKAVEGRGREGEMWAFNPVSLDGRT